MGYPEREDASGTLHHVMNQAIAQRPLFEDSEDVRFFKRQLEQQHGRGRIRVVSYCLMTTHYHLVLESLKGELAHAMRELQGNYTRRFNFRRERSGPLVRRRYLSKLVDSDVYFHTLIRYVDSNPVKAGMVQAAPQYRWGSARLHHKGTGPAWLCRERLMRHVRLYTDESAFPAGYRKLFGASATDGQAEWIERCLRSKPVSEGLGHLDGLVRGAPEHVQAWLRGRSVLADGVGLVVPVTSTRSLSRALETVRANRGEQLGQRPGCRADAGCLWSWMYAGLLRSLCSASWVEIAGTVSCAQSTCHRRAERHCRALEANPPYAAAAAEVTSEAIRESSVVLASGIPA